MVAGDVGRGPLVCSAHCPLKSAVSELFLHLESNGVFEKCDVFVCWPPSHCLSCIPIFFAESAFHASFF